MATSQDAVTFGRNLIAMVNQLIVTMQNLNTANDRLAQDPTLAQATADALNKAGRTGLTAQNFEDVGAAIGQVEFTLDSGSPTNYAKLYEIL